MERITIDVTRSAGSRSVRAVAHYGGLVDQLASATAVFGSRTNSPGKPMDGRLLYLLREKVCEAIELWQRDDTLPFRG